MIEETLSALADGTRRGVIDLLRERPLRAGTLAETLAVSAPTMSRHLAVLRRAGLVEIEDAGDDARVRVYRLRREPFAELKTWLEEVESFWRSELEAFAAHVEQRQKGRR